MLPPDIGMFVWNIAILVIIVLFLLAQYQTLRVISPANRELSPGEVWFQLIPVFNLYWQFIVVTRIADSLLKEQVFLANQDDSILGVPDFDAVEAIGHRPTYKIGMTWCTLLVLDVLLSRLRGGDFNYGLIWQLINGSLMICWILYWVELVKNKRKILKLREK